VSRAGGSIPTFAAPHYTSVSDRRHVVLAIPPLASKIDALAFLHLFRPGFGHGHVTFCQYTPFPDCNCILVECADSEVSNELQDFLRNTAFFGKYQCAFATLTHAWEFDEIDNEVDPDPVMEKLSECSLMQYIKYQTPAHHDDALLRYLKSNTAPEAAYVHYMTKFKPSHDAENEKCSLIKVPAVILEPADNDNDGDSAAAGQPNDWTSHAAQDPKDWFGIVEDVDENSQDDGNAMNF
jgi:hypothetical protein